MKKMVNFFNNVKNKLTGKANEAIVTAGAVAGAIAVNPTVSATGGGAAAISNVITAICPLIEVGGAVYIFMGAFKLIMAFKNEQDTHPAIMNIVVGAAITSLGVIAGVIF